MKLVPPLISRCAEAFAHWGHTSTGGAVIRWISSHSWPHEEQAYSYVGMHLRSTARLALRQGECQSGLRESRVTGSCFGPNSRRRFRDGSSVRTDAARHFRADLDGTRKSGIACPLRGPKRQTWARERTDKSKSLDLDNACPEHPNGDTGGEAPVTIYGSDNRSERSERCHGELPARDLASRGCGQGAARRGGRANACL
jgi:hypothetical protein